MRRQDHSHSHSAWRAGDAHARSVARPQGKLNVMTTTEDLARIAREVGGDKINGRVDRKGLPGSSFRRGEAQLHPQAAEGGSADRRRPRARNRLAAAAHAAEPQRQDPAGRAGLSRRVAERADPRDSRRVRSRAPWATCTRSATRITGSIRRTASASRRRSPTSSSNCGPATRRIFDQRLADFDAAPRRRREALARDDGALQGHEGRHLSPVVSEFRRALRPRHHRLRRTEAWHSADAAAHARSDQRDEAAEREARAGRAVLRPEDAEFDRSRDGRARCS